MGAHGVMWLIAQTQASLASFVAVIIEQTSVECVRRHVDTTERVSNLPGWAFGSQAIDNTPFRSERSRLDRRHARRRLVLSVFDGVFS